MIFNWVLINKLAVGTAPRNLDDIAKLKKNSIKSVLSLCSIDEAIPPKDFQCDFDCERLILPDHTYGRFPDIDELENALKLLNKLLNNPPVFVHCVASIERSPLVCLAWLVKFENLEPDYALQYMMDIHPTTNPLPGQYSLLFKIKKN